MPLSQQATLLSGNTAGSSVVLGAPMVISGGANVTVQASLNTLIVSAAAGGTGAGAGIALAAGTQTATTNTVVFSNSNGVTFGMSGSSRVTASVETSYAASNHSHGNPTLALTNLSGTTASASNGFTLSLSAAAGGGVALAAGTQTGTSGTIVFANSNGLSFGMSGSSQITGSHNALTSQSNQAVSGANGSSTFQTLSFANSNGVSWSTAAAGIWASVNTSYRASNDAVGLNTAQSNVTWTVNSSGLSFDARGYAGTGTSATNASITLNSAGLAISVAAPGGGAAQTFSAGTTSGAANPVVFSNSNGVSFGYNAGTITASVNAGGGAAPNRYYVQVVEGERFTTVAALSAAGITRRLMLQPFWVDGTGIQPKTVRMMLSYAGSSNRSFGGTFYAGIYSLNNSTQMTRLASDSVSYSITASSQSSAYNGAAFLDWTGMSNTTFQSEGRYAFAFACDPVSANATWMAASVYGADPVPVISRILTNNTTAATGNTGVSAMIPFWGFYSTTTNGLPSAIALSEVNGGNSASLVDLWAVIKAI